MRKAIEYDLEQERSFDYSKVDRNGLVNHIAQFVSGLWQIHPFGEGNTRTTAVFTILYLRSMGFDVTNDLFAKHSWYFRNALVRANYQNVQKGIMRNSEYLERFFRNLILGETNELRNRYMVVNAPEGLVAELVRPVNRTSTEQLPIQVPEQVRPVGIIYRNQVNVIILMVAFVVASLLEGFRCLASLLILSVCQSRFYSSLLMRHKKSLLFIYFITSQ